jgi:hypothetical protein
VERDLRSNHTTSSFRVNSQELSGHNTSFYQLLHTFEMTLAHLLPVFPNTSWNKLSKCGVGVTTNSIIDNRPESDESNM